MTSHHQGPTRGTKRTSQRLRFNSDQQAIFESHLISIRQSIEPLVKQSISREFEDTYQMLTLKKGLKGGRRRDHLRLVHKCLKPLVLYGSIACNVDIGVAGRKQSILQTTDGVMSPFSMMVKLPRNTTEAADAVLMVV